MAELPLTPDRAQSCQLNSCQQTAGLANRGAPESRRFAKGCAPWWSGFDSSPVHRDPLALSTSCCSCWPTSATTSPSCRRRCSGTGLTLRRRSSLYLRNFPAIRKPWTSALETTTPKEPRRETWGPPETLILSASQNLRAKGREEFSHLKLHHRGEKNTHAHHRRPRKDAFLLSLLFLSTPLHPNTIFRGPCWAWGTEWWMLWLLLLSQRASPWELLFYFFVKIFWISELSIITVS